METSPKVGRMCAMNLYLHAIGGDKVILHAGHDSLAAPWSKEYAMVLTNPPFGKKQSLLFVNEEGETGKKTRWSCAKISGPPPATSSSTSCSTFTRC